ncbi:MAG: NYN domain-containing protein [Eubacteriaceae bacterium]|nr:NYN domain-containing protein [Eubacteriaceae bacterium]MDD4507778.1 NYN domain-containing protein [Eubacteriaceae bacterium]
MEEKKFAILIDGDNISARYIAGILDEMTNYGIATYKRIYGDWTSTNASKWKDELLSNSITPIQQFSNVSGKNATDSALIIDAMDILYGGAVDGFCIVSSDSDFTRLASRLRESGMIIIGMGEEKTPGAFRNACTKFVSLENILDSYEQDLEAEQETPAAGVSPRQRKPARVSRKAIENTIASIITENENNGKLTGLGEVGSRLNNKYPDFDVRNYGYSLLSKFLEESSRFVVTKGGRAMTVSLGQSEDSHRQVEDFVTQKVRQAGRDGIELGYLGNMVHDVFPGFRFKDKGYSKFSKFVQSIAAIRIKDFGASGSRAFIK